MSYYDDDREEPSLTLSDILRSLEGEDRAALNVLMAKAVDALNTESGGLIASLKAENTSLRVQIRMVQGDLSAKTEALKRTSAQITDLTQRLANQHRAMSIMDFEKAGEIAAEIDRLKETVRIQRDLLNRHDLAERDKRTVVIPSDSPWSLFKAGLSSAFVKPFGSQGA